jgi:thermostable 8-oxoguanine DNA glycosylase
MDREALEMANYDNLGDGFVNQFENEIRNKLHQSENTYNYKNTRTTVH